MAAVNTFHFGAVSYFGTDADFGVDTVPSTSNNGGMLVAGVIVFILCTSPLVSLSYGGVGPAVYTLRALPIAIP